jgi:hypothetical protein
MALLSVLISTSLLRKLLEFDKRYASENCPELVKAVPGLTREPRESLEGSLTTACGPRTVSHPRDAISRDQALHEQRRALQFFGELQLD